MMRIFFLSLLVTTTLLFPQLSELFNVTLPFRGVWQIPVTGLEYMGTFFHELGHATAANALGHPSLPAFNFISGGGVTLISDTRTWAGFAAVMLLMVAGSVYLWLHHQRFYGTILGVFALVTLGFTFTDIYKAFYVYMGHGGAILVACYCILFALPVVRENKPIERYLAMIFGQFTLLSHLIFCGGLYFSDIARMAYKGTHNGLMHGDFTQLSAYLDTSIENIAAFSAGFTLLCMAIVFAMVAKLGHSEMPDRF